MGIQILTSQNGAKGPDPPPPVHRGGLSCAGERKEGPGPQELPPQEAVSFHAGDEDSSGLDLEQLLEEVGKELEQREEPRLGEDVEEVPKAFFKE
ncbi:hypothetical protein MC885_021360 [Smutsia gigantea]|nr:hypothetical protein MC885_021360 [Smutsia gigantea]